MSATAAMRAAYAALTPAERRVLARHDTVSRLGADPPTLPGEVWRGRDPVDWDWIAVSVEEGRPVSWWWQYGKWHRERRVSSPLRHALEWALRALSRKAVS